MKAWSFPSSSHVQHLSKFSPNRDQALQKTQPMTGQTFLPGMLSGSQIYWLGKEKSGYREVVDEELKLSGTSMASGWLNCGPLPPNPTELQFGFALRLHGCI